MKFLLKRKLTEAASFAIRKQSKKKPSKLKEGTIATRKRIGNTTQAKHVSMEKKTDDISTNEKVSKYIPDDIAFSILSKLPLKSFKRFECVCKSWSYLSETHHFMNMFRKDLVSNSHRCSYYDGESLLLYSIEHNKEVLYSLFGERLGNKIKLGFSNLFEEYKYFDILGIGSINGTLCLHQYDTDNYGKTVLWNPTTQTIKHLPPSKDESRVTDEIDKAFFDISVTSCLHGFGYNPVTNDYNVIRCVQVLVEIRHGCNYSGDPEDNITDWFGSIASEPIWEIYSLKSNSWRELYIVMPSPMDGTKGTQVYMDGVCHWLCEDKEYSPARPCLVSFYLTNEVSFTTPIPSYVDDCFEVGAKWINLVVLNGSIALISYRGKTATFHVSILGQVGFKESWIKLFMVGSLPCVEYPIGVGTKGKIFFIRKDKEVAWFDLNTQMIEELGYTAENDYYLSRIINYKESILPFEE